MLSIEKKVIEFSNRIGVKANNIDGIVLLNCADTITNEIHKHEVLTIGEMNGIIDGHLVGYKNPELSAIKSYVLEDLKILGYTFGYDQVFRK